MYSLRFKLAEQLDQTPAWISVDENLLHVLAVFKVGLQESREVLTPLSQEGVHGMSM